MQQYEKDTLKEDTFLEVFEFLNREELDHAKVQQLNPALASFLTWCRLLSSYHVLVHPYRIRNAHTIKDGTELHEFAGTVDSFMDQFYQLNAYLIKLEVLPRDTNFAFNLSHVNFQQRKRENYLGKLPLEVMSMLTCCLELSDSLSLSHVSRSLRVGVAGHWDLRLAYQTVEIETMKSNNFSVMHKKIPLLYEGGFFSPYVKLLDRILF